MCHLIRQSQSLMVSLYFTRNPPDLAQGKYLTSVFIYSEKNYPALRSIRYGTSLKLSEHIHFTQFPDYEVQQSLLVLLQHDLISYVGTTVNDKVEVIYEVSISP